MSKFRGYFAWNNLIVYGVFAWIATVAVKADQVSDFAYGVFVWFAGIGALLAIGVLAKFLADRIARRVSNEPEHEVTENDWGYICFFVASFWAIGSLLTELVLFLERSEFLSFPGTISNGGLFTVLAVPCLYAVGIFLKLSRKELANEEQETKIRQEDTAKRIAEAKERGEI